MTKKIVIFYLLIPLLVLSGCQKPESPEDRLFQHALKTLDHPTENARLVAVERLMELGRPEAIPKLLTNLKTDTTRVRKAICRALIAFPDAKVIDALIRALDDDAESVAQAAMTALIKIDQPARLPLKQKLHITRGRLHKHIVLTLGYMGDESVLEELKRLLEEEGYYREQAAKVLVHVGEEGWQVLFNAFENAEQNTRALTKAMSQLGPKALPYFLEGLKKTHSEDKRANCVDGLAGMKEPLVLPILKDLLYDSSTQVRGNAAFAVGEFKDLNVVADLVKLTFTDTALVSLKAQASIQKLMGTPDARVFLHPQSFKEVATLIGRLEGMSATKKNELMDFYEEKVVE